MEVAGASHGIVALGRGFRQSSVIAAFASNKGNQKHYSGIVAGVYNCHTQERVACQSSGIVAFGRRFRQSSGIVAFASDSW